MLSMSRELLQQLKKKKNFGGKEAVGGCFLWVCSPKMILKSLLEVLL